MIISLTFTMKYYLIISDSSTIRIHAYKTSGYQSHVYMHMYIQNKKFDSFRFSNYLFYTRTHANNDYDLLFIITSFYLFIIS